MQKTQKTPLEKKLNIAEVARFFSVHPNTMTNWKKYRPKIYRALLEWYATFYLPELSKEELDKIAKTE